MRFLLPLGALLPLCLCECSCPADFREVPRPRVDTVAQVKELSSCQIKHYGTTLLAEARSTAVASALLERGALPDGTIIRNGKAESGTALLHNTNPAIAKLLLQAGADAGMTCGTEGHSPLCSAARKGDTAALSLMLNSGVQPDTKDAEGATPLYLAAANLHHDACQLLLSKGASPDSTHTADNSAPLHAALRAAGPADAKLRLAQMLLQAGANPLHADAEGMTPLHLAPAAVTPLLIAAGGSVHAEDMRGRTPLFYSKDPAQAEALLQAGAVINTRDHLGNTAFDTVTDARVKSLLLVRGANSGSTL